MAYADIVLADSPVAYWPLKTDGADLVNGLDLSLQGAAAFGSDSGSSEWTGWLELGGASSPSWAEASSATLNSTAITYEIWVEIPTDFAGSDAWAQIMGLNDRVGIRRSSTSTSRWSANTRNASNADIAGSELTYPADIGSWCYLALAVDPTAGEKRTYVGGILESSETITAGPLMTSVTDPFTIGAQYSTPSGGSVRRYFAGKVAHAAIYHTALSDAQILAHYNTAFDENGGGGDPDPDPPIPEDTIYTSLSGEPIDVLVRSGGVWA